MKLFRFRSKHTRKRQTHDYSFIVHSTFVESFLDIFRTTSYIFRVVIPKDNDFPLRHDGWKTFDPRSIMVAGDSPYKWLEETTLPGKVRMIFWYTGWYSTFLHAHGSNSIEHGHAFVRFSNKKAAAFFKLKFHCDEVHMIDASIF